MRVEIGAPEDILCFAYAALRPEWPRRCVAPEPSLEYREAAARGHAILVLAEGGRRCDLRPVVGVEHRDDLGAVPPAPVVVRMASDAYRASEWCMRESELLDHLLERGDFMRGRVVIDAGESQRHGSTVSSTFRAVGACRTSRPRCNCSCCHC